MEEDSTNFIRTINVLLLFEVIVTTSVYIESLQCSANFNHQLILIIRLTSMFPWNCHTSKERAGRIIVMLQMRKLGFEKAGVSTVSQGLKKKVVLWSPLNKRGNNLWEGKGVAVSVRAGICIQFGQIPKHCVFSIVSWCLPHYSFLQMRALRGY